MEFMINNKQIIAEPVTAGNLRQAKKIDPAAEIGDYCVTLPDRTVEIMSKKMFEKLMSTDESKG